MKEVIDMFDEFKNWVIALVIFVVSGIIAVTAFNLFFADKWVEVPAAAVEEVTPIEDAVEETVEQ